MAKSYLPVRSLWNRQGIFEYLNMARGTVDESVADSLVARSNCDEQTVALNYA